MFEIIYIEKEIENHPKVSNLLKQFSNIPRVICDRYSEIFNRKNQDFRLQKSRPSLILAKKIRNFILETPTGYGIGRERNYYFSHMLNCIYDCRYCFLQGMYASANYVLFVNFDDFKHAIEMLDQEEHCTLFSGYDCDSLALESVTQFAADFLPVFEKFPKIDCEFRTKSLQIQPFLKTNSLNNVIIAYTLTPACIQKVWEHKTPSFHLRLKAMEKLQQKGWLLGIRFDPLIYCENYKEVYRSFFSQVFSKISSSSLHSVTIGAFRLPKPFYKKMFELYPEEKLFVLNLDREKKIISYKCQIEEELIDFCREEILKYIPSKKLFSYQISNARYSKNDSCYGSK